MSASSPAAGRPEDAAAAAANARIGARVFSSAVVFIFAAFVFAFFYLSAVNSNGDFRPAHTNPSSGYGVAILVCVIAAAAAFEFARRALGSGEAGGWRAGSAAALVLGVAVVALQVIQYATLGFKTAAGGYASVFFGWTLLFLLCWIGALYWIETLVAQSARGSAAGEDGAELLRPSADGCAVYVFTLLGIEIVAFVLLYLVK